MKLKQLISNPMRSAAPNCLAIVLLSILWTAGADALPIVPLSIDSNITQVVEGFKTAKDPMPTSVSGAWDSTFLVQVKNDRASRLGTATLVGRLDEGATSTLYFLTNYHVIQGFCDVVGPCQAKFASDIIAESMDAGLDVKILKGQLPNAVFLKKFSENPDLALLTTTIPKALSAVRPLPLSVKCEVYLAEPLNAIGFGDTSLRKNAQSLPIENSKLLFKRWSSGLAIGFFSSRVEKKDQPQERWLGTSLDLLPGNSGGPILNAKGEIVAITVRTNTSEEEGYKYRENLDLNNLSPSAFGVTCQEVNKFLNEK